MYYGSLKEATLYAIMLNMRVHELSKKIPNPLPPKVIDLIIDTYAEPVSVKAGFSCHGRTYTRQRGELLQEISFSPVKGNNKDNQDFVVSVSNGHQFYMADPTDSNAYRAWRVGRYGNYRSFGFRKHLFILRRRNTDIPKLGERLTTSLKEEIKKMDTMH